MIEIKERFGDWKEVDKEQAKGFVEYLLKSMTVMSKEEKIEYINKNKIRGITVQDLLDIEK